MNVFFTSNIAGSAGGAIRNSNVMFVSNSNFASNIAGNSGGAIRNILSGNLIVHNSNFISNIADIGGAIDNNATMSVSSNTLSGNSANILGNEIYNNENGTIGILNLTYLNNCTVKTSKGSTVTLYATLVDDMGNTVTGQNISFYLDGVFFENVTAIEGYANLTYTVPSTASDIPVSGVYAGNGNYTILINNGLLQVRIPTNITISVPEKVKVGDTVTLESKLTEGDGNPLAGKTIDFYVDGEKIGSAVTDSNGIAKLNYTFNKAGKPKVDAKFTGDNTYESSNATNQTIVSKIPTITTVETDKDKITVTLTDENANPLTNKKITIKVNGKTFTRSTDINGQVILKFLNANKYKVKAKFAGDNQYDSSKDTVLGESEPEEPTSTISESKTSTISASGKITMKETGIPIMVMLFALLFSIGIFTIKKDE